MKKTFLFALVILTVMSMLFILPATPAAAAGEKSIKLDWVDFIEGKGVVLVFNVKGNFDSFEGSVKFGPKSYPMSCNFRDDGKLACVISEGRKMIGKSLFGSINGFAFTTGQVPKPSYCYAVFDVAYAVPGWEKAGTYCQEEEAGVGDVIEWYNPSWNGTYWYIYSLDGSESPFAPPNLGPGYYWW